LGNDNYFVWITQATTDLLTTHSDIFMSLGMNLFRGFAVILVAWTGIQIALGSASGAGIRFDKFAGLLMTIAFTYAMIVYYQSPIPGIGISFHKLITDQGANLAAQIEVNSTDDIATKLAEVYEKLEQPSGPSILDVMQVVRYYSTIFILSFAQAAVLAVISYGFVATAVCVLVGPIFIPFFIVPHMEWMFWGWLKAFIQYAFYPVVGNAFVYVYGQLMLNFFKAHTPPFDTATLAGLFLQLILMSIAFVWGVFKVPSLVSSIFSGRSGDHALPGFGWWR
jgi:type IV secretory pathway VirB6-like protein